MSKNPQCPRCGDNHSPLVMVAWRPTRTPGGMSDEQFREWVDDVATKGICGPCARDVSQPDDTQAKLMAAAKPANPLAFPRPDSVCSESDAVNGTVNPGAEGMTLRDCFAAMAIPAVVAARNVYSKELGTLAYLIADQLLAARAKS